MGAKESQAKSLSDIDIFKALPQQYKPSVKDVNILSIKNNNRCTSETHPKQESNQMDTIIMNQKHPYSRIPTVQYFTVVLNQSQYQSYIQHLYFRKEHQERLIQIPFVELVKKDSLYCKLKLYVEYIPITLEQLINVHYLDILTILYWTIKGLQSLRNYYNNSHAFSAKMIGFTQNGQVKIWVNDKFTSSQAKIETAYHSHLWYKTQQKKQNRIASSKANSSIKQSNVSQHNQQFIGKQHSERQKQMCQNIQQQLILQNLQKTLNKHIDHQSIPVSHYNNYVPSVHLSTIRHVHQLQQTKLSPSRVASQVYPMSPISELQIDSKSPQKSSNININRMRLKLGRSYQQVLQWIESHSGKVPTRVASVISILQSGRSLFINQAKASSDSLTHLQSSRCVISMKHEHYSKELSKVIKFNYWTNSSCVSNQNKVAGVHFTYNNLNHSKSMGSIVQPRKFINNQSTKNVKQYTTKDMQDIRKQNSNFNYQSKLQQTQESPENIQTKIIQTSKPHQIKQRMATAQIDLKKQDQKHLNNMNQHIQQHYSKSSEKKASTIIQRLRQKHSQYAQQLNNRMASRQSQFITDCNVKYRLQSRIQSEISDINNTNLHSSEVSPRKCQKIVRSNSLTK